MKFKLIGSMLLLLLLLPVACTGTVMAPTAAPTAVPPTAVPPTMAPTAVPPTTAPTTVAVKATTAPTVAPTTAVVKATTAPTTSAQPTLAATKPTTTTAPATGAQATTAVTAPTKDELTKGNFAEPQIARITAEQVKQMMDKKEKFILIDARGQASYLTNHIEGAISIPNNPDPPVTQMWVTDRLEWLAKDALLVFYCD